MNCHFPTTLGSLVSVLDERASTFLSWGVRGQPVHCLPACPPLVPHAEQLVLTPSLPAAATLNICEYIICETDFCVYQILCGPESTMQDQTKPTYSEWELKRHYDLYSRAATWTAWQNYTSKLNIESEFTIWSLGDNSHTCEKRWRLWRWSVLECWKHDHIWTKTKKMTIKDIRKLWEVFD